MSIQKNRRWILIARPKTGPLNLADFQFEESKVPAIDNGEFLIHNQMLSFDASQRVWMVRDSYMPKIPLGDVVRGLSVGTIIESKNEQFPVGMRLAGLFGWQEFAVSNGRDEYRAFPLMPGISEEAALSVFGLTGLTGYFGMTEIGHPLAKETVVVSGASGATGSVAAQVAKNLGAYVIGIAGGQEKCAWLTKKAGLNAAIDYKSNNVEEKLSELAPHGVDVYFDNVGGAILDAVLANISKGARVVLCGAIATYEGTNSGMISNYSNLIVKRGKMEGFLVTDYASRFPEGISALASMVQQGKMKYEVDIQHGLENAPQTLQRLFDGKNLGKQLLSL